VEGVSEARTKNVEPFLSQGATISKEEVRDG